ncbi:MAG: adenylate/guanylate cyclase domain-containing protein [Desulfamplus sp.]|nr:adenylate/guanylate cyclase domain-containing protein [Desulfamplus sp.]
MLKLRNKKQIKAIMFAFIALLFGILILFNLLSNSTDSKFTFFNSNGTIFNNFDFKVLDIFYRLAVKHGAGPKASFSPEIIYLNITDETYNFFDKNYLDRKDMADLNNALSQMRTQAVIYDIIFARKSSEKSDLAFYQSLERLGNVYLPTALILSEKPSKFRWKEDKAHDRIKSDYLGIPHETGIEPNNIDKTPSYLIWNWWIDKEKRSSPFYAVKALTQQNDFAIKAKGSGDISAKADADGIYRHITMVVKIDDKYFPTLSLAVFLDWAGISLDDVKIEWGDKITIPLKNADDVIIPIDKQGRTFIPFVQRMGKDFSYTSVNNFLSKFQDEDLRGNLLEQFEGNFVFVADIAIGTSDLGHTPLQNDAPLVITHASLLNAMLTNTFYKEWAFTKILLVIFLFITLMALASIPRASFFIYGIGIFIILFVPIFTWFEILSFNLFPVVTVTAINSLSLFVFIIVLETSGSKERLFIRNTFARYVPEKVVNTLLAEPEMVKLGGEERIVTVLFSDIENFTSISETLSPTELVNLLNEYFTEMSEIIMKNGGIIDKFQGDSIMAEFGVPLPVKNHPDMAVTAALQMLKRLSELREIWKQKNTIEKKPYELYCRIGINTNNMIVGNMGSKSVLDYTVIGDAVNLASRLEGANKNYGTYLMISEFTYAQLTVGRFKTRILDYVRVKGKTKPVRVYEVYGQVIDGEEDFNFRYTRQLVNQDSNKGDKEDYYQLYRNGFEAYLAQRFIQATALFKQALNLRPEDKASIGMLDRISKLEKSFYLDKDWDGSIKLMSK